MVDFGKIAYDGYCKKSDGKSLVSGATLPNWKDLGEEIKDAWRSAADAVLNSASA